MSALRQATVAALLSIDSDVEACSSRRGEKQEAPPPSVNPALRIHLDAVRRAAPLEPFRLDVFWSHDSDRIVSVLREASENEYEPESF
ncbi:hypothetical protein EYF80_010185 [Liparis tanakae]|uniref:Uncharacterized protein n=1 Tax=Liparis tanakae TaxID=230148 RepID=A0A4Z2IQZ4_9TELE|nr:hypothetical protein EYF80_010185 [Liparis tanakae]